MRRKGTAQMTGEAEDGSRGDVIKATTIGYGSGFRSGDDRRLSTHLDQTMGNGFILPPVDPRAAWLLFESSSILRQNVDAYVAAIESHGFRILPNVDPDDPESSSLVADEMLLEALNRGVPLMEAEPRAELVEARFKAMNLAARAERVRIQGWFECAAEPSFTELRKRSRMDLEVTGNSYWEVIPDLQGAPAMLQQLSAVSMRVMPLGPPTLAMELKRRGLSELVRVPVRKHFCSYVQIDTMGTPRRYFREFGDPALMSSSTGKRYQSMLEMQEAEPGAEVAHHVIHHRVWSPRSPYGIPRWIGGMKSILGSRSMEHVNMLYFESKTVPPLAVLVSGGARLMPGSIERLETFFSERLGGADNFHSVLVLQAEIPEAGEDTGGQRAKIELKPLTEAQMQDATHMAYDEANRDKVGEMFRNPGILRGKTKDQNRATANAAIRTAEDHTYGPDRESFDANINRTLMPSLGARFTRFVSNSLRIRDPERAAVMLEAMAKAGVLTPEEARKIAEDIFNTQLRRVDEEWAKRPIALTLAGIQTSQVSPQERGEAVKSLGMDLAATRALMDWDQISFIRDLRSLLTGDLAGELEKIDGEDGESDV